MPKDKPYTETEAKKLKAMKIKPGMPMAAKALSKMRKKQKKMMTSDGYMYA